jgi:hypothetical protein
LNIDQPFVLKILASSGNKKGKGHPREHKFVVGYKGYCSVRNDGCPITFIVGFTEESLKKMLQPSIPSTIELEMQVSKACMHPKGHYYVLSLVSSDIRSTILGLVGLFVCKANRLVNMDSLSTETLGQVTRADLLAVFSSGAVLLNGISKLDVTSALAESVVLDGETLLEPIYNTKVNRQQDMTWALESVLAATAASTAVLLVAEEKGWSVESLAGVVPRDSSLRDAAPRETPILNRFRKDISKETYLPTLQALPGHVEFTYLPPNTQGLTVLVLGTNTAKSFSPRDVAWCQVLASRIGTFLQ